VLEDYEPLRKLLEDLEDKGYLYRSRLFDYKHIGWRLTPIGENRIEVYKTYPNLLPYDLVSTKSLQILLGKVREEITHTILEKYSRYMFACEALIVNILNNHV
jgi:DNA-binding MarR family transcriptional regulator